MIKKIMGIIKAIYEYLKLKRKLRFMDRCWYFMGGSCFGMFPPSFYYTHTEAEIRQISEERIANLHALMKEWNSDYTKTPD